MSGRITPAQLLELREKHRVLWALRQAREAAMADGLTEFPEKDRPARRATMQALAAQFPGSLRELDEASAAELAVRLAEIEAAVETGAVALWMETAILFHWALRDALRLRRGLLPTSEFWEAATAAPLNPPTGRLLDVVWEEVAARLEITSRAAEVLVYPRAPMRGTRVD